MTDQLEPGLGCSKCRYSKRGCKRCRDSAFQERQRQGASAPQHRKPVKRRKIGDDAAPSQAKSQAEAPATRADTRSQTRSTRSRGRQQKRQPRATKAPAPDQQPQAEQLESGEAQAPQSSAQAAAAGVDAQADQLRSRRQQQTSATAANARDSGSQPTDTHIKAQSEHRPEADAETAAPSPPALPQPSSTTKAHNNNAADQPPLNAQAAPPAAASEAATAAADQSQTISEPQSQHTRAADQPQSTPGSNSQQTGKSAGKSCSQATATDSRPSFLSMLQSKMDKRRQEKRESQSAGSASDSSMSSVHAAGTGSAGKAGASVDSKGTQAPQAMNAPRHKVKQQRRRSSKKAPAKTRAFLQRGPDPRQALWHPPVSPYGLIEEYLYEDPWKLLVACMLLNVTSGAAVRKVIWKLFEIWPSAEVCAGADDDTMVIVEKLIQPLGLFRKRTIAIKRFSQEYLEADWLDPIELHGIGQYASDAYFMFCRGNWQDVDPSDKDLLRYQQWLHSTGGEGTGLERDALPDAALANKINASSN